LNGLLPAFFTSLLNLSTQPALAPTIFTTLHALIPDNATIFRQNLSRVTPLVFSVIDENDSLQLKRLAGKVYVDLHHAAQKDRTAEYWRNAFLGAITEYHLVLDTLFTIVEERMPVFFAKLIQIMSTCLLQMDLV